MILLPEGLILHGSSSLRQHGSVTLIFAVIRIFRSYSEAIPLVTQEGNQD